MKGSAIIAGLAGYVALSWVAAKRNLDAYNASSDGISYNACATSISPATGQSMAPSCTGGPTADTTFQGAIVQPNALNIIGAVALAFLANRS